MVTNLPPNAQAFYKRVVASKSKSERLQNLRIFASMIPEHKGTEKLRANIKRQIAKLEGDIEREKNKKRQIRHRRALSISKNKDELLLTLFYLNPEMRVRFLSKMSNLSPEAFYSDTVRPHSKRVDGVNMIFLPVSFSLATSSEYLDPVRQADGALFAVSSESELDACATLINSFEKFGVFFTSPGSEAKIVRSSTKGINVIGSSDFLGKNGVIEYLSQRNLDGATVELSRFSTNYSLDAARGRNPVLLKFWVLLEEELYSHYKDETILLPHSIPANARRLSEVADNPMNLLLDVLSATRRIRVWTKEPKDKAVSEEPVLLKEGASVIDLAKVIHKELATEFKYAILHRPSENIERIRVGSGFLLRDGDVVEIH